MIIHMLVDREPGYDPLVVGDIVQATTEWVFPENVPDDLVLKDLRAIARSARLQSPLYSIQLNGGLVNALVSNPPDYFHEGEISICGCLAWDRNMRDVYPSFFQQTCGRIVSLGVVLQEREEGNLRYVETHGSDEYRKSVNAGERVWYDCVGLVPIRCS